MSDIKMEEEDVKEIDASAATSTSEALSGDQMSQIADVTLSTIASSSVKEILEDAKTWEEDMLNAPDMPEDRERAERSISGFATTAPSMPPPSWFNHNLEPLKKVFKRNPKADKEKIEKTVDPRSTDESRVLHRRGLILMIHHKYRII
ncbi:hypothetical protein SUGI_1078500 [Cryptomeria japonica]|nr:hypothetical protein SUGI_1078500 [Cryptomeria japonica]